MSNSNETIKIKKKLIRVNNKRGITILSPTTTPTPPPVKSFILQEDSFYILQEDGSKIEIN